MTHVLFVTPYYPPEVGAPQTRISETAACLVRRGHRVSVLTTVPNYPTGIVPDAYRHGRRRREERDGVAVRRVWSYVTPNRGFLGRILSQLSFGCLAPLLAGRDLGRPDIIIVESPPLFDAIAGRMLARRYSCPFIFTVADIWPESAVQLGMLRNRLMIWMAEWLEWSTYRRAGAVWSVTAGIREVLIGRGLPEEQVFLLPNGVDTNKFRPQPREAARAELGWPDGFTVLYAGTIGLAHSLDTLLAAADLLHDHEDIRFVLAGEGAMKAQLKDEAVRRGLRQVTFLDALPHDRMPLVLAAADACLVSLRKVPLFEGALPSKMYEAMACARPMILAVDGEARRLVVDEAGAAVYARPEQPEQLAKAVLVLRDDPDGARQLGTNGRAFVERRFNRDALSAVLEERILALTGGARTRKTADPAQTRR